MRGIFGTALLAALVLSGCANQPVAAASEMPIAAAPHVFVVRHMQKADGSDDPPLTAEGAANAQRLADLLGDKGIAAIFASPTRRAMETAAPLASRLGLAVTPYDPHKPEGVVAAAARVAGSVLVVGHSNTVPDLVARFGGPAPAPMTEQDYGTVFVVDRDGRVMTLEVR